jgi:2-haloacid dehalogenase
MVGGKSLGLTVAWINRRGLDLDPSVPSPDLVLPRLQPLCALLGN